MLPFIILAPAFALARLPQKYKCSATLTVPYADNTQHMRIVYDLVGHRELVTFYNAEGAPIDGTYINPDVYYNARTERDHLVCYEGDPPSNYAPRGLAGHPLLNLLPELTYDWLDKGLDVVKGREAHHYYFVGLEGEDSSQSTYNAYRAYQYDFWCYDEGGYCIPVRWTMRSISAFGSHFDLYNLDYNDFSTVLSDDDFVLPPACLDPVRGEEKQTITINRLLLLLSSMSTYTETMLQTTDAIPEGRMSTYLMNRRLVDAINANPNYTFTASINCLSTYTFNELKALKTGFIPRHSRIGTDAFSDFSPFTHTTEELPRALDWRVRGVLSMVKDQVACGSCWAFGAIGTIEALINIHRLADGDHHSAPLLRLSEQAIVDCFWGEDSYGCDGGDTISAFRWLSTQNYGRLALEDEYPYLGQDDICRDALFDNRTEYRVTGYIPVESGSVNSLKAALMEGPVAIAIGVAESLMFYTGGVYNDPACPSAFDELAHAVICVGWGTDALYGDYWIVRNSWSPRWGMDGYVYIAMKDNICGVLTDPCKVTVEK
ncbi:Cathepsin L [Giardia muris]|uniref:Cathepsin L n=1 Tax=Giardia muris TaxID=5742 RepID=A0A4Z1T1T7_GIAMU|nr:Cathepsin L [Giardia muris]|eukprot:TNJ26927.1 Cathepsin L [Giardia muris]